MRSDGLSRVSTGELERLLRAVHRELLPSPLSRASLIGGGFGHIEEHLGLLLGLERIAVARVIVAVLAERRPRTAG
jgi:hypothetical protein